MTEEIGRVLGGRYRVVAPIGRGASAVVYLADDVVLKRRVAVKMLHPALADDAEFLRRFRAEAQAVAALSHPHVMAVFDWGQNDDVAYLVTELLAGGSLRSMLDHDVRLSPSQATGVALEAAQGLEYAHRGGFVHRDVKPANLLFGDDGRLRIADFGLARALSEAAWTEPQGAVLGTARYASPEQAQGERLTGRADVYSLALVVVEAVTGQVPFTADTTIGTLMARIGRALEAPEELGPLGPIVERAASPDPGDRPDAHELVAALTAVAADLPPPAELSLAGALRHSDIDLRDVDPTVHAAPAPTRPEAPLAALAPVASGVSEPPDVDELTRRRRRRRRWPIVVVSLLLLIGAAVAVEALDREPLPPAPPPTHEVPPIIGTDVAEARRAVDDLGWRVVERTTRRDDTRPGEVIDARPAPGRRLAEGGTLRIVVSEGTEARLVPQDLTGKALGDAAAVLAMLQLTPVTTEEHHEDVAKGAVIRIGEGTPAQLFQRDPVPLVVSLGPRPRAVPTGLAGSTRQEAEAALAEVQLSADLSYDNSETVTDGDVIAVPAEGSQVPRGSTVEVVVSLGPKLVAIPDVASTTTLVEAVATLQQAGFSAGSVAGPALGKPVGTTPPAGTMARRGSAVDITLG